MQELSSYTCQLCQLSLGSPSWILSGDGVYWPASGTLKGDFERNCQHADWHLGHDIVGCPMMQEAVRPSFPSLPNTRSVQRLRVERQVIPDGQNVASGPNSHLQQILEQFQSLGDNCEFGLVQRWAGAEPVHLLRFAGLYIPLEQRLDALVDAIDDGFTDLGNPEAVVCELHGDKFPREYMARETKWKLFAHTGRNEEEVSKTDIERQQVTAYRFMRRRLMEDLESAHRIFVWKSNDTAPEQDVRKLLQSLRRRGPNLLLWLVADEAATFGQVEYLGEGLLKGHVRRFAAYGNAGDIDFQPWHAACRTATVAADFLGRCGEWSQADSSVALVNPAPTPPLPEVALEDAATTIDWEERRSDAVPGGSVSLGTSFRDVARKALFETNPGSQDVRTAAFEDIVFDTDLCVLMQNGRKIRETRYLVERADEYQPIHVKLKGLRFVEKERIAIIGFNRPWRSHYHWMMHSLPALVASVRRAGAEQSVLVLPPLPPAREEALAMLGLADIPRITVDLGHQYHFARAYYSEFLRGHTSYFLSPLSLAMLNEMAVDIEALPNMPERLYVGRADSPNRRVINEDAVQVSLEARGFVSVNPGALPMKQQIALFKNARVIVGAHGAGLANLAFCRPGTVVLELMQSTYLNACMNRIAQARGLAYHGESFACDATDNVHQQAWMVDIDQLTRTLDGVLRGLH